MRSRSGFTLVEILIVVVILGILAAIVVPQFTNASVEAQNSRLMQDLQSVRSQIELYKIQHMGTLPSGTAFTTAMTGYTDQTGAAETAPGTGVYGPYLQKMPSNPYASITDAGVSNGTVVSAVETTPVVAIADTGWFFNTVTGEFGACTTLEHLTW